MKQYTPKIMNLEEKDFVVNLQERIQSFFNEKPSWQGTIKQLAQQLGEEEDWVAEAMGDLVFHACPSVCIDSSEWEDYLNTILQARFLLTDEMVLYSRHRR